MASERFRTDSAWNPSILFETRHGKNDVHGCLFSWEASERQNTSKMVLGAPSHPQTDPWWSTAPPPKKIKRKNAEMENENLEIPKCAKMRTDKSSRSV